MMCGANNKELRQKGFAILDHFSDLVLNKKNSDELQPAAFQGYVDIISSQFDPDLLLIVLTRVEKLLNGAKLTTGLDTILPICFITSKLPSTKDKTYQIISSVVKRGDHLDSCIPLLGKYPTRDTIDILMDIANKTPYEKIELWSIILNSLAQCNEIGEAALIKLFYKMIDDKAGSQNWEYIFTKLVPQSGNLSLFKSVKIMIDEHKEFFEEYQGLLIEMLKECMHSTHIDFLSAVLSLYVNLGERNDEIEQVLTSEIANFDSKDLRMFIEYLDKQNASAADFEKIFDSCEKSGKKDISGFISGFMIIHTSDLDEKAEKIKKILETFIASEYVQNDADEIGKAWNQTIANIANDLSKMESPDFEKCFNSLFVNLVEAKNQEVRNAVGHILKKKIA